MAKLFLIFLSNTNCYQLCVLWKNSNLKSEIECQYLWSAQFIICLSFLWFEISRYIEFFVNDSLWINRILLQKVENSITGGTTWTDFEFFISSEL